MVERKTEPRVTIDHDEIRRWAEARGARPAAVKGVKGPEPGIIPLDLLGSKGNGKLEQISWEEWFKKFEEAKLAFVYREKTSSGERSNFKNLVAREPVESETGNTKEAMPRPRRKQPAEAATNGERRYRAGSAGSTPRVSRTGASSRTDGSRQKRSRPKRTERTTGARVKAGAGTSR